MIELKLNNKLLKTPFIVGSSDMVSTFEEAERIVKIGKDLIGAIVWKSTTLEPRIGYKEPIVCDYNRGFLVASGMKNIGIEATIRDVTRFKEKYPHVILLVSIASVNIEHAEEELVLLASKLRNTNIDGIELNLSCPHQVAKDKYETKVLAQDNEFVSNIVRKVKEVIKDTNLILSVKLTGWNADIASISKEAEKSGADDIVVTNIFPGIGYYTGLKKYHNGFDYKVGDPLLGNFKGGYTGASMLPATLLIVNNVKNNVDIPVLATGGCMSSNDTMIQAFFAGASAIVSSTFYHDKNCHDCRDFYDDLSKREKTLVKFMKNNNFNNLDDLYRR